MKCLWCDHVFMWHESGTKQEESVKGIWVSLDGRESKHKGVIVLKLPINVDIEQGRVTAHVQTMSILREEYEKWGNGCASAAI